MGRNDAAGIGRRSVLAGLAGTALTCPATAEQLFEWAPGPLPLPSGRYRLPDRRIRIIGTGIMANLVGGLNKLFTARYPDFTFAPDLKPGLMAIGPVAFGTTPFAPMPRRFTPVEHATFRAIAGRDPISIRVAHGSAVARDRTAALAIYVHRSNPIAHLSLDQIHGIFGTGRPAGDITTWGQLGLSGDWAARPIHVTGTPEDVGFGSYFVEEKFGRRPLNPSITMRATTAEVVGIVGSDVSAIAYGAINFATANTRQVPIGVATERPWLSGTEEEIVSGIYPLDRFIYFYALPSSDGSLEPWIREYFRLALSPLGQAIVASDRDSFLPLDNSIVRQELRVLGTNI